MKRLRGFSAQLLLLVVLPLFLLLSGIALGSVLVHQRSMRALLGERDLRAVRIAAAAISTPIGLQSDEHLRSVFVELQASLGTEVMLVDAEGRIVYDTSPQRVGQASSHPGVAEALVGRSGLLYCTDQPGGQEHVVAYFVPPPRVSDLAMGGQYGLMGMQERAQLVGAELDVDSRPQMGTVVAAHWRPNKRAAEAESEDSPARSQR